MLKHHTFDSDNRRRFFFHVVVVGNIASGKTALLETVDNAVDIDSNNALSQLFKRNIAIVLEPVEHWRKWNLLQQQYDAIQSGKAATSGVPAFVQTIMRRTQTTAFEDALRSLYDGGIIVQEQHADIDAEVYELNLFEQGHIAEWQHNAYWVDHENQKRTLPQMAPTHVIYLNTATKTCLDRIHTRGRPEEQSIPLSYLDSLQSKFDKYVERVKEEAERHPSKLEFIDIDATQPAEVVVQRVLEKLAQLDEKIDRVINNRSF